MQSTTRAVMAELLGTYLLTLLVSVAMIYPYFGIPVPVVAGLTLATLVFTLGKVSGCHVNPAVTMGVLSLGKIGPIQAGAYIVAQVAGAYLAVQTLHQVALPFPPFTTDNASSTYLAEGLATAVFTFGIASVVLRKQVEDMAASFVIGTSLILGVAVSMIGSNGFLNPAIAFAVGSGSVSYIIAPIVGSMLAFNIYKNLFSQ